MKVETYKGHKVPFNSTHALDSSNFYDMAGTIPKYFDDNDRWIISTAPSDYLESNLIELPEQPKKADDVIERDNNNFNQKTDFNKQEKYKGDKGDFIDEYFEESTTEEFRGAMEFTIQKYWKRMGKKDDILLELYKIADYSMRFYEKEKLRRAIEIEKAKRGE